VPDTCALIACSVSLLLPGALQKDVAALASLPSLLCVTEHSMCPLLGKGLSYIVSQAANAVCHFVGNKLLLCLLMGRGRSRVRPIAVLCMPHYLLFDSSVHALTLCV
jgi:hypothetical protein